MKLCCLLTTTLLLWLPTFVQGQVFISEIHYDNASSDKGEAVEVEGPAGTDLSGWSIVLYNGSNGAEYNTIDLSGTIPDEASGRGALAFLEAGIQNGAPDGLALINDNDDVVEFLSYEGSFTAVGGTADGMTSTDIGVSESSSTPEGQSLQLIDGTWTGPAAQSFGLLNTKEDGQVFISEIHYDNASSDKGEAVEVEGPAGTDLSGWSIVLYNGSNGAKYNTIDLSGTIPDEASGRGALAFLEAGIQNGAPDGLALINDNDDVVEFLSYEGSFTAVGGTADGMTSTDIGVSESSSTPEGQSLQLIDGTWTGPAAQSFGLLNTKEDVPDPIAVKIHQVQGSGDASPLVGQTVTVEGIVTGNFQDGSGTAGDLDGFFLQEEDADADTDPLTSEGIFVFDGSSPAVLVNTGDHVKVTGQAAEEFGLTVISSVSEVIVMSSGNSLPTAAQFTFDFTDSATRDAALESVEGMLVMFTDTLQIIEQFNFDRFGEVVLIKGERPFQYAQLNTPDVAGYAVHLEDIASRRIVYDDGRTIQNPFDFDPLDGFGPFNTATAKRMGDTTSNLSGALSYAFGEYRLHGTGTQITFTSTSTNDSPNHRPMTPPTIDGNLKIASVNVLNFFTTLDGEGTSGPSALDPRGADSQEEFDRQLEKLINALVLLDADILALVELENEIGDQNGDGKFAIEELAAALSSASGEDYVFVDPGVPFVGGDAIMVGIVYKTSVVALTSDTTVAILTDSDLPGLGLPDDPPVFDGAGTSRAPLAASLTHIESGVCLTVAVNHFKSKGSIGPGEGNEGIDDGAANNNALRLNAAIALDKWLDTMPTGGSGCKVVITGDLNAYAKEDPITFLESEGFFNVESENADAYSFTFDGQIGTLDYIFVDSDLQEDIASVGVWHINEDEADAIDYNLDFGRNPSWFDGSSPARFSDHGVALLGLNLSLEPTSAPSQQPSSAPSQQPSSVPTVPPSPSPMEPPDEPPEECTLLIPILDWIPILSDATNALLCFAFGPDGFLRIFFDGLF